MNIKLKALCSCVVSASVCAAFSPVAYALPQNGVETLTEPQIQQRLDEINSSYEVGEAFSADDRDFVLRYAEKPSMARKSKDFSVTKTSSKTTVTASGTIYHNGTVAYSYGGRITAKKTKGKTPKKYLITVSCVAYGVVGNDGIGKIYDDSKSVAKRDADSFVADINSDYAGVMVAYCVSANVGVTTSTGDYFDISSSDLT